jgi:hypothetical protein
VLYDYDWLELANTSAYPVDLAGLRITTERAGLPQQHIMPALSFMDANGFLKLIADGGSGATHLALKLAAEQDDVSLLTASGQLLDTVAFYDQTTDYSQGRFGSSGFSFFELPTAGLANGTSAPGYANALALLRGLRITQVMYNPIGGNDFDYVELTHVGTSPLDLTGVKFVKGIDFVFPVTSLSVGSSVIVCANLTKFRSRYGNGPVVAGVFSGKLDNGGERLAIQLPPPFDANILNFAYANSWYLSADGGGTALYVTSPADTKARDWDERVAWNASVLGGNPAGSTARTDTYSGWMTLHAANSVLDDADYDSAGALMEFSLGMDPLNGNGTNGIAGLPVASKDANGKAQLTFLVPVNALATQGHGGGDVVYRVQATNSLLNSYDTIATKTFATPWTGTATINIGSASNRYVPVTVTDAASFPQRFLRLQMQGSP